jgi:hypothetical protein
MKIAKYVGDLLYDYECVVIPGLGGFITKDNPVSINEVTHNFSPPFRSIHFNIHIRANDGLLVNHVAQQEQIGYKTAKQKVDQFAFQCRTALEAGKKINFNKVGSICYDNDKNIIFNQDVKSNYNPNSFGLTSLVSPAIRRVTDEEKIKNIVKSTVDIKTSRKKPIDRKISNKKDENKRTSDKKMHANRRKSTFANQIIFLLVVVFIMGSGYIYMRRDAMEYYIDKYSSHIPFFYSSVNDYLSNNINSTPVAQLSRSTASLFPAFTETDNANSDETIIVESTNNDIIDDVETEINSQPKVEIKENNADYIEVKDITSDEVIDVTTPTTLATPEVKATKASTFSKKYFLIAGSFSKETNAQSLVKELKNKGFKALIADTNKYGMYRVAFMSLTNRALAENKLLAIRNQYNPKAWLLVK